MSYTANAAQISTALESVRLVIESIALEVWEAAELSHEEVRSSAVIRRELEAAGFNIVSVGTANCPTAFIAEWSQGSNGPKIGFLAEYDALPGLGNAAVPRKELLANGSTNGHGCGHNMLGAALVGAAMAAKQVMEAEGIAGTLRLYGCAGEETEGAKVYMAREGLFNDLDACLHWHPASLAGAINFRLAAANSLRIEWFGQSAHAAIDPWMGRSAVDAMELASHGINLMREHVEPTARIHYALETGGVAPNVVPDYARLWMMIRDVKRDKVIAMTDWIKQIAEGAAMATQTRTKVNLYYGIHDVLPNGPLAQRMQAHIVAVGTPDWTEEEQDFAREVQKNMGAAQDGLATTVLPLQNEPFVGGSSDVAEVSWITPTMGIGMPTTPLNVSSHTWGVTACGGMSIGLKGTVQAAHVLLLTALDLMVDADLRAAARADFMKRTENFTYRSPLPDDQVRPTGIPSWMNNDGSVESLAAMDSMKPQGKQ